MTRTVQDHQGNARTIDGSLYFGNDGNLFDQFLVNRSLLNSERHYQVNEASANIFAFTAMVDHRVGQGPIRFGLPKGDAAANVNQNGFSDHFPIVVEIDLI